MTTVAGPPVGATLSVLADATAVMTFLGIVMVALFGTRLRELIISVMKARALRQAGLRSPNVRLGIQLVAACHRRVKIVGHSIEDWSISGEILWLSATVSARTVASHHPWAEPCWSASVAQALRSYARKLELATWVRLGSSTLADEEANRAARVAAVLEKDADFRAVAPGTRRSPVIDLQSLGVEFLAGPSWAMSDGGSSTSQRAFFDELRVSSVDTTFGAFGPLDELQHHWPRAEGAALTELTTRAETHAAHLLGTYPDSYNGVLPRLVQWRVEASSTGPGRRLHLRTEQTTFLTWLATNGDPDLPEDLRTRLAPAHPAAPLGANHIPVSVAITSCDGYVVLPQRASDLAIYPNCYVSAANGNVEVKTRHGMPADLDEGGFVDFLGAAARECREELGSHLDIGREDLRVSALIRYSDRREREAPVLVLQAVSNQDLVQIIDGIKYADPVEGAFEIGHQVLGVPTTADHCGEVVPWLVRSCKEGHLTVPGFVSTITAIASIAGPSAVAEAMSASDPGASMPPCVRVMER